MNALAKLLTSNDTTVEPVDRNAIGALRYVAKFQFDESVTNIYFLLKDYQVSSDVVITNMTTLPETQRRKGCGSKAVQAMRQWAIASNLNEIRATQIRSKENESFWLKNGFEKYPEPNPCNDFVFTVTR